MSTNNFSNNSIHFINASTIKKPIHSNQNKEKIKSKKILNNNSYDIKFNNESNEISFKKETSKNKFISISEFEEIDKENTNDFDNLNYINIIQSSVFNNYPKLDNEKIRYITANAYLNKEKNQISSFNDFKLELLNRRYHDSSFIFNRNNIDINNSQKIEKEKNNQIKRYRYLKLYKYSFNPITRRNNALIIQKWWKLRIVPKISKRKKILKIQSVYRGYLTRKNINDIICISLIYQNFINKIKHALGNFVHRNYFPKRYYKKKYAVEKILPIKLKLFYRRWKQINNNLEKKEQAAKFLVKIKENKKYYLLILKAFIKIWKLKCEHFAKNEDKIKCLNMQEMKLSSLHKLFDIIEKIVKRNAFHLIKEKIYKYLNDLFRNKAIKKLFDIYEKNKIKGILKIYLEKWRINNWKNKEKDLKKKIFDNRIKAQIRKSDEEFMRNNLNILRSRSNLQNINELKRAKKDFLYPKAAKHITNCVRKNIIRLIIKEYIRKINLEKVLLKIILKSLVKYYFNKWKRTNSKLSHKEKYINSLKKLIMKLEYLSNNKKCKKYFNRWKNIILMNKFKDKKINSYQKFCDAIEKYILNKNRINKKIFITKKLNKYINPSSDAIRKILIKRLKKYEKRKNFLEKKKYLNKWKKYTQYCKLMDLKVKNLETVSRLTKVVYNSKKLSKNLYEWKTKNILIDLKRKSKFKDNIKNIIDCLLKIKNKRMKVFFDCITEAKNKMMKKIILKILFNKYTKRIIFNYFYKYRMKVNMIKIINEIENINKFNKLKNILNNKIKKIEKNNYGLKKKCLYKWYLLSKYINVDNYNKFLQNIKTSIKHINTFIYQRYLRNAFELILNSKINIKNNKLQKLKKYFYKNDQKCLRNAFHKFLKNTKYIDNNIIKSKIIYNLKYKIDQMRNKSILSRYFNRWKTLNNIYISQRNNNIILITNYINQIIKRRNQKLFINNLKKIKYKYILKNLSKLLFDLYNKAEHRYLLKYLKRWRNNSLTLKNIEEQKEKGYHIIYKTLSKAYSCKKLEESLIPLLIKNYKKRYYKEFIKKFKQVFLSKIKYNYQALIKNDIIPKKYNFKFKKTIKLNIPLYIENISKENETNNSDRFNTPRKTQRRRYILSNTLSEKRKSNLLKGSKEKIEKNIVVSKTLKNDKMYIERIMPFVINYLNELRLNKLRFVFAHLNDIKKNNLFCILLKSFTEKQIYINKNNLLNLLDQLRLRQNLYITIRKYIIHKITTKYLEEIKIRRDLLFIVRKTIIYKKVNGLKSAMRFLRMWKIYIKLLKNKALALEKFKKGFSETYERLSDSMFLDNDKEKSVQTQVFNFLDKINFDDKNNYEFVQNRKGKINPSEMAENNDISNSSSITFINCNESSASLSKFNNYNINKDSNYKGKENNILNKSSGRKIISSVFKTKSNK